ncbi:MAG: NAD-dependent epimerase/dehydratase family protein [Parafilimonas sp.]
MHTAAGKILVTGATGLVGSHLIKELTEQDKPVKALYRTAIPLIKGADKTEWIKGDILDIASLEEAMHSVDYVYHCAAIVSFNPKRKKELYKTNVEGTANIVNTCIDAGVKKLLYVSSVAALGRLRENTIIDESMHWTEDANNSQYGKSKYLAEMEVWRGIGEGLQAVIVNPSMILGAGNWHSGSSEIFKTAYNEFPWFSEGVTGLVDVNDVVNSMVLLMNSSITSERFIISSENITYKELFTAIANSFGKKPPHKKVTPFIAALVWRMEALKSMFTNKSPFLTKETAATALAKVYFDNSKLLNYFHTFRYTPIKETVARICNELKQMHTV